MPYGLLLLFVKVAQWVYGDVWEVGARRQEMWTTSKRLLFALLSFDQMVGMVRRIVFVSVLQRLDTAAASVLLFAAPLRN